MTELINNTELIIISYNCRQHTVNCINSALRNAGKELSITVVDNNSSDDTVKILKKDYPQVKLIKNDENLGYAGAVNKGAFQSDKKFLIISNADVVYLENSIETLIKTLDNDNNAAVAGPAQFYPDGTPQRSFDRQISFIKILKDITFAGSLTNLLRSKNIKTKKKKTYVEFLDGAVHAVKKDIFDKLQGFDEAFFFYYEETDFCMRVLKNNYKLVFQPDAKVIHVRGGSTGNISTSEANINQLVKSLDIFLQKHYSPEFQDLYLRSQKLYCNMNLLIFRSFKIFKKSEFVFSKIEYFSILRSKYKNILQKSRR